MKYYASHNKQLSLDLFRSSLEGLDKSNRWVSMGDLLPWPELEREYNSRLNNSDKGAGNKPARLILGAMLIKHKKKGGKFVRSVMSLMLDYLHTDLRHITELLVNHSCSKEDCLQPHDVRLLSAIYEMYGQQRKMFEEKTHVCANRIVRIYQPHVRPIIRGKAKAKTEFGAKIGASLYEGYTFIDHHSWDAYNESSDRSLHINKSHGFGQILIQQTLITEIG